MNQKPFVSASKNFSQLHDKHTPGNTAPRFGSQRSLRGKIQPIGYECVSIF